jgi:hypothetical protein
MRSGAAAIEQLNTIPCRLQAEPSNRQGARAPCVETILSMLSLPQWPTARSNSTSVRCLVTPLSAKCEYVVKACGGSGRCSLRPGGEAALSITQRYIRVRAELPRKLTG